MRRSIKLAGTYVCRDFEKSAAEQLADIRSVMDKLPATATEPLNAPYRPTARHAEAMDSAAPRLRRAVIDSVGTPYMPLPVAGGGTAHCCTLLNHIAEYILMHFVNFPRGKVAYISHRARFTLTPRSVAVCSKDSKDKSHHTFPHIHLIRHI